MDVGAIGSLSTALSNIETGQAIQLAVQKKAMDVEQQSAEQLVAAISNPPNLGNNVDTFA